MECDICGKKFRDSTDLNRHKKKKTPCLLTAIKITNYQCHHCNNYYSSVSNLNKHITVVHTFPEKLSKRNFNFFNLCFSDSLYIFDV